MCMCVSVCNVRYECFYFRHLFIPNLRIESDGRRARKIHTHTHYEDRGILITMQAMDRMNKRKKKQIELKEVSL